jgi:hypothetical protein
MGVRQDVQNTSTSTLRELLTKDSKEEEAVNRLKASLQELKPETRLQFLHLTLMEECGKIVNGH